MTEQTAGKEAKGVEAVDRALAILLAFHQADRLTLAELSRATGLYKSTLLRLSVSLERSGFLHRMPDKSFMLGAEAYRLGSRFQRAFRLEELVRPVLQRLLRDTGESASFFVRDRDHRLCLFRENSAQTVREHISEGETLTLERGAAGHVIVRFDPQTNAATEVAQRFEALPLFSYGERMKEVSAAAVPVFRLDGSALLLCGALSVSGPTNRFTPDRAEIISRSLMTEGDALSRTLGGAWSLLAAPAG